MRRYFARLGLPLVLAFGMTVAVVSGVSSTSPTGAAPPESAAFYGPSVPVVWPMWSQPTLVGGAATPVNALSCVSSTFCVVSTWTSTVRYFDGAQWSAPVVADPDGAITTVACVSRSFCVLGDYAGNIATFDGTAWSAAQSFADADPGSIDAITEMSCVSAKFCMAFAGRSRFVHFDGNSWTASRIAYTSTVGSTALACGSTTLCVAANGAGDRYEWDGTTWQRAWPDLWQPSSVYRAAACNSPTTCFVTTSTQVQAYQDGRWETPKALPGGVNALSCANARMCVGAGYDGVVTFDAGKWLLRPSFAGTVGTEVSCAPNGFCVIASADGNVRSSLSGFTPLTPTRLLDTRTGYGQEFHIPLLARDVLRVDTYGAGVPRNATAVAVNVTVLAAPTFVTLYPSYDLSGADRPRTSTLNVTGPDATSNFAIVGLLSGAFNVYSDASGGALIIDVMGYFSGPDGYHAVVPSRALDTRTGAGGVARRPLGSGGVVTVKLAGVGAVPAAANLVAVNLTAAGATRPTFLTLYPASSVRPFASSLSVPSPQPLANFSLVRVGAGGSASIYNDAGSTHVIADVQGYASGGNLRTVGPARLFDTRTGAGGVPRGPLAARHSVRVKVAGTHGVPAGAIAVALNVTVVGATQPSFVTLYPSGVGRPLVSTVSPVPRMARANFTIVKIGADGYLNVYNDAGATHVLADVVGYVVP